jgi:uncharacterized protein YdeI (YjbR/CyaY-like superfamily)
MNFSEAARLLVNPANERTGPAGTEERMRKGQLTTKDKKAKQLLFTEREQWRSWLLENHASESEAWLVFHKKHTGLQSLRYDDAVEEALCFGWIDSVIKRIDDKQYMQKFTPRKKRSEWSELNKKRARKMLRQGMMAEPGLERIKEAKADGRWGRGLRRPRPTAAGAESSSGNPPCAFRWNCDSP